MALELKQHLKLSQQLIMTPQLQQAIKLLQLSRIELQDYITEELQSNPLLEADTTTFRDADSQRLQKESQELLRSKWDAYLETYGRDNTPYYEDDERPSLEASATRPEGLYEHLFWQLRMNDFTDKEREVGVFIIGNLDHNGYLTMDTSAICEATGCPEDVVVSAIAKVQLFDPTGIAARDLKDCLHIQARTLGLENSVVWSIIDYHLEDLQTKNYDKISHELGVSVDEVSRAAEIIVNMEPRPARDYSDEPPQYVVPDVYVVKMDGEFVIVLNEEDIPALRLNKQYQGMMTSSCTGKIARDYLSDCFKSAQWLMKSIQQRQSTLCKVTESIVKFQREFLEHGISHLKPLVLRDVADDVGMHESTISRVTSNKYVHTPQGTFELKYFFNSGISRSDGSFVASQSVKNEIENIIKAEDPKHPLSDQAIAQMLKVKGVKIARRTVAKYRELLGIVPSNRRKKHY
ncbi:MAG: RNA polymerase sigma-54 factor [Deltaproteobacteria bacterium ADurb.BinA179]|jgi:RNA polymerase sigma-54 factor|nr:RNA polymerase factor sigma-54 [Deltaproteobacteria bacterium]MDI9543602.1 RNA polymerase factor sigma-54 [Pseudomonadota bacterium]OPZ30144.1 MAG: RNA polymerase sigma-54 factor [Deltaproteobacteria bacterium ADurb.BinA179]HNR50859.1 RNA polymerase factor sigma-54 [Deltaproteobacteria bacterium]HOD71029.1 RNA polymerase factor sigma-54 [Deltaproteobacteria bacterium]